MRFKIDENLPAEFAELLRSFGHDAETVLDEQMGGDPDPKIAEFCRAEDRILMTLDLDFADIRHYPPRLHPGFVVFRLPVQDKNLAIKCLDAAPPRPHSGKLQSPPLHR